MTHGIEYKFANFVATELEEGISQGATELIIPVLAAAKLPVLGVDEEIRLVLWDGQHDPEIIGVTSNPQTGVLTVVRSRENTSARAWGAGTSVRCVLTAEIINEALAAFFDLNTVLDANFLKLSGGTLTGALTLPGAPTTSLHAVTKAYADTLGAGRLPITGGTMTGSINMGSNDLVGLPSPVTSSSAARKSYIDNLIAGVQGQIAAGTAVHTTTGSASAYVIASTTGDLDDTDLVDGISFIIRPHITNDLNATLKVDLMTAKPIQERAGLGVTDEVMFADTPYTVVYDSGEDAWVIAGAINITALQASVTQLLNTLHAPSGTPLLLPGATVPTGWTQDATVNDRVIRVVSTAGGGVGGSWVISGLSTTIGGSGLSEAMLAVHAHTTPRGGNQANVAAGTAFQASGINGGGSGNAGSGAAHGHSASPSQDGSWRPSYLDVMRITKD